MATWTSLRAKEEGVDVLELGIIELSPDNSAENARQYLLVFCVLGVLTMLLFLTRTLVFAAGMIMRMHAHAYDSVCGMMQGSMSVCVIQIYDCFCM